MSSLRLRGDFGDLTLTPVEDRCLQIDIARASGHAIVRLREHEVRSLRAMLQEWLGPVLLEPIPGTWPERLVALECRVSRLEGS